MKLFRRYRRETSASALLAPLLILAFSTSRPASATVAGNEAASSSAPPTLGSSGATPEKRPPADPVKFALQLLRTDTANAADATGTTATIGTPTLTTFDGSTATLAVTGDDFSYTIAFSPKIESGGKMVQILWSVKISGKSLPGGATGVTLTGASKVLPTANVGIAEISLADPATGRKSVFRLQGVTTIGDSAGAVSTTPP